MGLSYQEPPWEPPEPADKEYVEFVKAELREARKRAFDVLGVPDPRQRFFGPRAPRPLGQAPGWCHEYINLGGGFWKDKVLCSFRSSVGGFCRTHAKKNGLIDGAAAYGHGRRWTRASIIVAMWLWATEHEGVPPRVEEWRLAGDHPNYKTVRRLWGSWPDAVEAAGFERPRVGAATTVLAY